MRTRCSAVLKKSTKWLYTLFLFPSFLVGRGAFLLCTLFFLFFFCVWGSLFISLQRNSQIIENSLHILENKSREVICKKRSRENFFKKFRGSNPNYLKEEFSFIQLLHKDKQLLHKLQERESFYTPIKERYEFLLGEENGVHLQKVSEKKGDTYKKSVFTTKHAIEASCQDLERILSIVEGIKIASFSPKEKRPQLFFQDISVTPKGEKGPFLIEFSIIQRDPND